MDCRKRSMPQSVQRCSVRNEVHLCSYSTSKPDQQVSRRKGVPRRESGEVRGRKRDVRSISLGLQKRAMRMPERKFQSEREGRESSPADDESDAEFDSGMARSRERRRCRCRRRGRRQSPGAAIAVSIDISSSSPSESYARSNSGRSKGRGRESPRTRESCDTGAVVPPSLSLQLVSLFRCFGRLFRLLLEPLNCSSSSTVEYSKDV